MNLLYTQFFNMFVAKTDFATKFQMDFQDPATPVMEAIINFHHDLMFFLILIVVFTAWIGGRIIYFFSNRPKTEIEVIVHGTLLEIIWTITPAFILVCIAIPSFSLLYAMDEVVDSQIVIKIIGNQWYWSYEFEESMIYAEYLPRMDFDSYMIAEEDLAVGRLRLLEVDNRLVIPVNTHVKLLITSSDVLHCWAVPSLGIKLDACPGRLNQVSLYVKREGTFFGQCSEICGVNHGFMPIAIDVVDIYGFLKWYDELSYELGFVYEYKKPVTK